jgi:prepilin-type N-terminal cleavage/methylation domain-containing protein
MPTSAHKAKLVPRTVQAVEFGVHMRTIIIEAMQSLPATRLRARIRARVTQAGFTLIELMVVLVIIGVLAALIVPTSWTAPTTRAPPPPAPTSTT